MNKLCDKCGRKPTHSNYLYDVYVPAYREKTDFKICQDCWADWRTFEASMRDMVAKINTELQAEEVLKDILAEGGPVIVEKTDVE